MTAKKKKEAKAKDAAKKKEEAKKKDEVKKKITPDPDEAKTKTPDPKEDGPPEVPEEAAESLPAIESTREVLVEMIKARCRITGRRVIEADHARLMALDLFNAMLVCPECNESSALRVDGAEPLYQCQRCGAKTGFEEVFDFNQD